ncbi:MAG: hypothetical protein EA422_01145 [Gemmatimonadales bacterium]|nr:MAG: hypothetical protein EA422_01145 [Gemmatimonadales bacterium]
MWRRSARRLASPSDRSALDFFQAQENARRQSQLLVGLFAAAVLSIIIGVYLTLMIVGGVGLGTGVGFDPILFGVVALGTLGLIGGGSLVRTAQLRKGGSAVAELMGGRAVDPATRDPRERQLMNVVEEMSLASGMPVPAVYVMDGEPGINAFAAGYTIHDAAVAVTRGTLQKLNREELQGVVAHEFSHILNGDMRLNIRLIGLLFGILLLAVVGRGLLRGQMVRRRRENQAGLFLGLALVALGYVGVFFGKLIKAAVSRQREFLADAAAVEFTRNPRGIAGALAKIGKDHEGSRIQDHHAEELSHLFFSNGLGSAFARSLATHPPLQERIRRLDPRFQPSTPPEVTGGPRAAGVGGGDAAAGLAGIAPSAGLAGGPASVRGAVGSTGPNQVARARELLRQIPERLREAAHDHDGVQALILGLLGGRDPASDQARSTEAARLGSEVQAKLARLVPSLERLPVEARLPLVDLSMSALHGLSEKEGRALANAADAVVRADGEVRAFDFVLTHILWRHLPGRGRRGRRGGKTIRSVDGIRNEVALVLSALAWQAGSSPAEVTASFERGVAVLANEPGSTLHPAPREAISFSGLDQALERIERAKLEVRGKVLEACAAVILTDEPAPPELVELLRGVAESLELPLPPF